MVKLMILSKIEGADAPGARGDSCAAAANDRYVVLFSAAVRISLRQVKRRAMFNLSQCQSGLRGAKL